MCAAWHGTTGRENVMHNVDVLVLPFISLTTGHAIVLKERRPLSSLCSTLTSIQSLGVLFWEGCAR